MWFDKNPEYIPPTNIVPRVSRTTAKAVLHPTNVTKIRHMPGGTDAVKNIYILYEICVVSCFEKKKQN